jgi:hypothetical protein
MRLTDSDDEYIVSENTDGKDGHGKFGKREKADFLERGSRITRMEKADFIKKGLPNGVKDAKKRLLHTDEHG